MLRCCLNSFAKSFLLLCFSRFCFSVQLSNVLCTKLPLISLSACCIVRWVSSAFFCCFEVKNSSIYVGRSIICMYLYFFSEFYSLCVLQVIDDDIIAGHWNRLNLFSFFYQVSNWISIIYNSDQKSEMTQRKKGKNGMKNIFRENSSLLFIVWQFAGIFFLFSSWMSFDLFIFMVYYQARKCVASIGFYDFSIAGKEPEIRWIVDSVE